MPIDKLSKEEKATELKKYKALNLATIDYYVEVGVAAGSLNAESLKSQVEEQFQKGSLARLKQWFRDLTEMQVETVDLKFNKYLQDKTGYDIDIFDSYYKRVDKILKKGKITTDSQFYDINMVVDQLCHVKPVDNEKIRRFNSLLFDYEQRKAKKR